MLKGLSGGSDYIINSDSQSLNIAIVVSGGNSLSYLNIENSEGVGVFIQWGPETVISNNNISNSQYGIIASSATYVNIKKNKIHNNSICGIHSYGNAELRIRDNDIQKNLVGLNIDGESIADLGIISDGNNIIKQNTDCDCYNGSSNTIYAYGNEWDQEVISQTIQKDCIDGNDIVSPSGNIVLQYIPDQSSSLFSTIKKITLVNPVNGSVIQSNTPSFRWDVSGSQIATTAVFKSPAIIKSGKIQNTDDIVWLWHSGIEGTIDGNVSFDKGISNYKNPSQPESLDRGKLYYWASWAWDDQGLNITHSSTMGYFTVTP